MSTSGRSFTYPQIEGTLLERVRHNLRLHDCEYNHLTPQSLLEEIDAAIKAPQAIEHVTSCAGCPFHEDERSLCMAGETGRALPRLHNDPPEWCPLRSGPILVTLKVS